MSVQRAFVHYARAANQIMEPDVPRNPSYATFAGATIFHA